MFKYLMKYFILTTLFTEKKIIIVVRVKPNFIHIRFQSNSIQ